MEINQFSSIIRWFGNYFSSWRHDFLFTCRKIMSGAPVSRRSPGRKLTFWVFLEVCTHWLLYNTVWRRPYRAMAEQIPGLLENSQKQDLGENDCPLNEFILSPSSPLPPPQIAKGSFSYTVILYSLKKITFNFFSCFQKKQAAQKAEHSRKKRDGAPSPQAAADWAASLPTECQAPFQEQQWEMQVSVVSFWDHGE